MAIWIFCFFLLFSMVPFILVFHLRFSVFRFSFSAYYYLFFSLAAYDVLAIAAAHSRLFAIRPFLSFSGLFRNSLFLSVFFLLCSPVSIFPFGGFRVNFTTHDETTGPELKVEQSRKPNHTQLLLLLAASKTNKQQKRTLPKYRGATRGVSFHCSFQDQCIWRLFLTFIIIYGVQYSKRLFWKTGGHSFFGR